MTHQHGTGNVDVFQTFSCETFRDYYLAWKNNDVITILAERMEIHWDSCSGCMAWAHKLKDLI